MNVTGRLIEVVEEFEGSSVKGDVAAGATTFPLADLGDFAEDGLCSILDAPYSFIVDEDAGTIVVDPPLAAAAGDGTPVYSLTWDSQLQSELVAVVDLLDDEAGVARAEVPVALRPMYPVGPSLAGALVDLTTTESGYMVAGSPMRGLGIDGTFIGNLGIAASEGTATTEPMSGTSLPATWTSVKTNVNGSGSAVGALPGVSVISSGAPAGASGSTLLIHYGAAGLSSTDLAGAGYVDTNLDAADALVSMRYRQAVSVDPLSRDAELRIFIRAAGTPWADDADGIFLDLTTAAPEVKTLINGSVSTLVALPALVDPTAQWHQAQFQIRAGLVQARVWPESDPEPAWTTVDQAGILTPGGIGIAWREFPFVGASSGQRAYIDQFDVTTYPTGFVVNPDGTGSWPAIEEPLRARLTLLEEKSQAGKVSTGTFAAVNTPQSVDVFFKQPFASPPSICVSALIVNPQHVSVSYSAPTTKGFTVWASRSSGSAGFTVAWHAHLATQ